MPLLPGEPPHADDVAPRGTPEWRRAVDAHRQWIADQAWRAQSQRGLNLSDPEAMKAFLATLGVTNEVGGGRHAYNLFLGNLPSEGFGMSTLPGREGMSYAMEAYMPDWKRWIDRSVQGGTSRADANARFFPTGGFTPVPNPAASTSVPTPAPNPAPSPNQIPGDIQTLTSDRDPWDMARSMFRRKRPGLTLGTLGGSNATF
jgi:hypothetical protein